MKHEHEHVKLITTSITNGCLYKCVLVFLSLITADIKVLLGMMVDTAPLLQLCLALGIQISGCGSCGCQSVEVASSGAAQDYAPAYLGQLPPVSTLL